MLGKVFKAYDVRATYPNPLNESTAWKIGYATARYLIEQARAAGETDPMMQHLIIGRDMRPSSPALAKFFSDGMRLYGAHVIDVGLVDTPFIYFAINHLDCAGGVQTTASHNPINYNGFKISGRRAFPIGAESGLEEISKYAAMADQEHPSGPVNPSGRIEQRDLWAGYRAHVLSFLELGRKTLKVVVDASNGMAGTMVPQVFGGVKNLKISKLHFDNTGGKFAHEPNPLVAANLEDVRAKVLKEKADFGVCFDGDADRCIFVDEKARIVGCDLLTAVLARQFIRQNPGAAVVYDLRSSKVVEEEIRKEGGKPIQSRVGHVFMKAQLRENQAVFGGELSGHFYFRDNFNADSGAIVFASVASLIAQTGKRLGDLIAPLARYSQSGEINFENEMKDEALEKLEETFGKRGTVSNLDGVSIDCFAREGWWCNVRKSNTEPLLRLNLEARNKTLCEKMVQEISPLLGKRSVH